MISRSATFAFASFSMLANIQAQSSLVSPVPPETEIRRILAERTDTYRQSVGIVVGVIEPAGRRIVTYGRFDKDDPRPVGGDTIFEIGSVTKVFTSLALSEMVEHGDVALSDPITKYLPSDVRAPERGGRSITLLDLATQTSGLPRLPTNFAPKDPNNPYVDYSPAKLYEFLASYKLTRDIGSQYEYSNLGVGLLGHLLARRAGSGYETLIRSRIAQPLGMSSTVVALSPEQAQRLTPGHNGQLARMPNWDFDALAGCGALRSSANDLLTFLAAILGYTKTPLAPAMAAMLKVRRPTGSPNLEIALGWHIFTEGGRDIVWHNGGTYGYRSFVGYDPKARVGVVAFSNTFTAGGVDDIGRHLLDPSQPLAKLEAPKKRVEVAVDPKVVDRYTGRYQLAPNFILTVTREGARLFAQATGQPKLTRQPPGQE